MRQNILIFAGILGMLFGVFFALQGAGIINVPAQSSMVDNSIWVTRGIVIAVVSAILVAGVRLVPSRAEEKARRRAEREAAEDAEV